MYKDTKRKFLLKMGYEIFCVDLYLGSGGVR